MARLGVPIVSCIIGEGGSGGAIAIAVADRVLMQENAIYSVISPEGCAAILWRDAGEARKAAAAFKPDARALARAGRDRRHRPRAADGGAQTDHDEAARLLGEALELALAEVEGTPSGRPPARAAGEVPRGWASTHEPIGATLCVFSTKNGNPHSPQAYPRSIQSRKTA